MLQIQIAEVGIRQTLTAAYPSCPESKAQAVNCWRDAEFLYRACFHTEPKLRRRQQMLLEVSPLNCWSALLSKYIRAVTAKMLQRHLRAGDGQEQPNEQQTRGTHQLGYERDHRFTDAGQTNGEDLVVFPVSFDHIFRLRMTGITLFNN